MSFTAITVPEYTDIVRERLVGETPEMTWLKQFREILTPYLSAKRTIVDFGCCTGYAYKSFAGFGVDYIGVDFEDAFLDIGRNYYGSNPSVRFLRHDINLAPARVRGDIVISSAMLEHCPSLSPALEHMADAAIDILLLRTFVGSMEAVDRYVPPVAGNEGGAMKYSNVYARDDLLTRLEDMGFDARIIDDEYTGSKPRLVEERERTFFIVFALRKSSALER